MINEERDKIIDLSVRMETCMRDLYSFYAETFPRDRDFWEQLSREERTHAALIESARKYLLPYDNFPESLLFPSVDHLSRILSSTRQRMNEFRSMPPSLEDAVNLALELERAGAESRYHQAMQQAPDSEIMESFQEINRGFKNHAERIHYFKKRKMRL